MREGRGKEEQKGNGDRGDEDSDRGWLRRRYRREAAAYSYNMFAQYSRSGPVGLLSSLRLPPISLSLSHASLAALFSQVQRRVTSTQMSLEQGEANEPGIPWEGGIMGHRTGGAYGAGAFQVTTLADTSAPRP